MLFDRSLREATKSVHVDYPVPYLVTILAVSGVALFTIASLFTGMAQLFVLRAAGASLGAAILVAVWAVLLRPNLLRSARFHMLDRFMTILGDSDMDSASRERLQFEVLGGIDVPKIKNSDHSQKQIQTS